MNALQTIPETTTPKMTSISDVLTALFTDAAPCQVCGKNVPTYYDREKDSHYCLSCLETAVEEAEAEWEAEWLATPLRDGPVDPEIVAYGRAFLDEYFATTARKTA